VPEPPTPPRSAGDTPRDLVLYDGVCALCNGAVRFILRRDRTQRFVFAPLQSEPARELLSGAGIDASDVRTIYLVEDYAGPAPRISRRSRAVLAIAAHLTWPWRWLAVLRWLPSFLLDPFYRLVAWSRYRMFGKLDACAVPAPEWRGRFLWEEGEGAG